MKLIKAFVRANRATDAVRALQQAGAPGISVSRVHGLGYGYDQSMFTMGSHVIDSAPEVVKLEIVCYDEEVDPLIETIVASAQTGAEGDGILFVTPVERAVRLRTGEEYLGHLHQKDTRP